MLRPERRLLEHFFEHERGLGRSWKAAMVTLAWTLAPWMFWSRVRLHHQLKPLRMFLWLVVVLASIWPIVVAVRLAALQQSGALRAAGAHGLWYGIGNSLCFPVLKIGRVRSVYLRSPIGLLQLPSVEYLTDPWSTLFFVPLTLGLTLPALLVLIAQTRRRAKVRAGHVLRAAVYGQAWIVLYILLLLSMAAQGLWASDWESSLGMWGPLLRRLYDHMLLYELVLIGWIGLWWWLAMARGWGIAGATLHWLVLMVPALLASVIVALKIEIFLDSMML
ncbi:MAG: hypothetical protein Kow0022_14220 [Phycisphaerales bacterium]